MTKKVLILGHSFVRRFEQFVLNSLDARVNENLNLNYDEVQISYSGHGGASLERIRALGTSYVREQRPDVVIIQAVSNDLCKPEKTVDLIFRRLIEFVVDLRYGESVRSVVILTCWFSTSLWHVFHIDIVVPSFLPFLSHVFLLCMYNFYIHDTVSFWLFYFSL